jgi:hypothetical protein
MNMRPRLRFLACLTASIAANTAALAEESYPIAGMGAASCGKWIEARELREPSMDALLTAWVQGFLSGMNTQRYALTRKEMVPLPDPPSILAYVDKYCRDNPLQGIFEASTKLYIDMEKR